MSGSNTAISQQQFKENEKKIRVDRILSAVSVRSAAETVSAKQLRWVSIFFFACMVVG